LLGRGNSSCSCNIHAFINTFRSKHFEAFASISIPQPNCFEDVYEFFAEPDAWYIYEDVIPVLESSCNQGIELRVISYFDHRLYPVLESLGLYKFLTSITISTEVGTAKPDAQIFQAAIAKHDPDQNFWHIGDSFKEDYQGAKNANIRGIWLDRSASSQGSSLVTDYTISSFQDLLVEII
jgi:HAD superfamily hydrolase (TIGR01549 family)